MTDSMPSMDAAETSQVSQTRRLSGLLRRPELRGIAIVIAVKLIMVVLNFTLIALAARALDTAGFGTYSMLFSAAGLLLIVGAAGQELFVIRAWNEYAAVGKTGPAKGALLFSAVTCLCVSLVVAAVFYAATSGSYGTNTALSVAIFLCLAAPLQVTAHLLRTAVNVAAGDGFANILQLSPAVVYLAISLFVGSTVTVSSTFAFLALGAFSGLAVHVVIVIRLIRRALPSWKSSVPTTERRAWLQRSLRLLGANTLEAINQHIDVLIIGFLLSPSAAGAYFVTVRIANLFAAAADAINLFATRHFSRLYHAADQQELEHFLDVVAWITLASIGIGLLGIGAGGYFALWLMNPAYAENYPALMILCLGTAALAVSRPGSSILMLTGYEGRYVITIAVTAALRVVALYLLAPGFGIMGAVTATAVCFALTALVLRQLVADATGLDTTVLRLLRSKQATAS